MRLWVVALAATFVASPAWALSDVHLAVPTSFNWDKILDGAGSRITFGVSLHGPSPYTRNNTTPFAPASNSKLFTAALALERLGTEGTFTTTLVWDDAGEAHGASNLRLIGSGDPSLVPDDVDKYAAALAKAGVTSVFGDVKVEADDPRWDIARAPTGWTEDDSLNCDGAAAQAFNVDLNCAFFEVRSTIRGRWLTPGVPTPVRLDLERAAHTRFHVSRDEDAENGFKIVGTLARGVNSVRVELPVLDAKAWVRNLFIRALSRHKIEFHSADGGRDARGDHRLVFQSPTLRQIIKPLLKKSQNLVAEALLRGVASRLGPSGAPDLVVAGEAVLREFVDSLGGRAALAAEVAPQPGFYGTEVVLHDGSGLSRSSRVTTDALMALLLDLRERPDFAALWDALPIAGVDGTLASRMKGTAAEGVLRAKTGTLDGVYNLSGYVPRKDSYGGVVEYVPFVILTKTDSSDEGEAHKIEDQIGAELARQLGLEHRAL